MASGRWHASAPPLPRRARRWGDRRSPLKTRARATVASHLKSACMQVSARAQPRRRSRSSRRRRPDPPCRSRSGRPAIGAALLPAGRSLPCAFTRRHRTPHAVTLRCSKGVFAACRHYRAVLADPFGLRLASPTTVAAVVLGKEDFRGNSSASSIALPLPFVGSRAGQSKRTGFGSRGQVAGLPAHHHPPSTTRGASLVGADGAGPRSFSRFTTLRPSAARAR
ncbi:MAG: hypothetical protein QOF66_3810 [Mycobacterium sp.]|jgi:hypothetical protein|nr:hypothetical protein [Mycobacterium sp.]